MSPHFLRHVMSQRWSLLQPAAQLFLKLCRTLNQIESRMNHLMWLLWLKWQLLEQILQVSPFRYMTSIWLATMAFSNVFETWLVCVAFGSHGSGFLFPLLALCEVSGVVHCGLGAFSQPCLKPGWHSNRVNRGGWRASQMECCFSSSSTAPVAGSQKVTRLGWDARIDKRMVQTSCDFQPCSFIIWPSSRLDGIIQIQRDDIGKCRHMPAISPKTP